jgi:hypothetical protein
MTAGESQSVKHESNECHLIETELRVNCVIAGEWGS